jgi:hypothetical protein
MRNLLGATLTLVLLPIVAVALLAAWLMSLAWRPGPDDPTRRWEDELWD